MQVARQSCLYRSEKSGELDCDRLPNSHIHADGEYDLDLANGACSRRLDGQSRLQNSSDWGAILDGDRKNVARDGVHLHHDESLVVWIDSVCGKQYPCNAKIWVKIDLKLCALDILARAGHSTPKIYG